MWLWYFQCIFFNCYHLYMPNKQNALVIYFTKNRIQTLIEATMYFRAHILVTFTGTNELLLTFFMLFGATRKNDNKKKDKKYFFNLFYQKNIISACFAMGKINVPSTLCPKKYGLTQISKPNHKANIKKKRKIVFLHKTLPR